MRKCLTACFALLAIASSVSASLILSEDFEGTGTPSGWGTFTGSPNFDYSAVPLVGLQSLRSPAGSAGYGGGFNLSELWFKLYIKLESLPTSGNQSIIVELSTGSFGTQQYEIVVNDDGTLTVSDVPSTGGLTTTDALSAGTVYNIWGHFKKGTGLANCQVSVAFDVAGNPRPDSGPKFAGRTNGTGGTSNPQRIVLGAFELPPDINVVYDNVEIWDADPLASPTPTATATATATFTPTSTATATATSTFTPTPTVTATVTATATATATATVSPAGEISFGYIGVTSATFTGSIATPTATVPPTPTATATFTPTATATATFTPTPTPTPAGEFVMKSLVPAGASFPDNRSYARKDFASAGEVWLTFEAAFEPDSLNKFLTNGGCGSAYIASLKESTTIYLGFYVFSAAGNFWDVEGCDNNDFNSPNPTTWGGEWHQYELHFSQGALAELYIDTTFVGDGNECQNFPLDHLYLGQESACGDDIDEIIYYRNVKVGTSRFGDEIFSDDFSSGDFSHWDATVGSPTLVPDPYP